MTVMFGQVAPLGHSSLDRATWVRSPAVPCGNPCHKRMVPRLSILNSAVHMFFQLFPALFLRPFNQQTMFQHCANFACQNLIKLLLRVDQGFFPTGTVSFTKRKQSLVKQIKIAGRDSAIGRGDKRRGTKLALMTRGR